MTGIGLIDFILTYLLSWKQTARLWKIITLMWGQLEAANDSLLDGAGIDLVHTKSNLHSQ